MIPASGRWPSLQLESARGTNGFKKVECNLKTPDLWAELQRRSAAFPCHFLQRIRPSLRTSKTRSQRDFGHWGMRALDARLDYLVNAARRLGRKDWLNVCAGAIRGLILTVALPREATRGALHYRSPLLTPGAAAGAAGAGKQADDGDQSTIHRQSSSHAVSHERPCSRVAPSASRPRRSGQSRPRAGGGSTRQSTRTSSERATSTRLGAVRFVRRTNCTGHWCPPPGRGSILRMITYSVFRLAARRTDRSVRDSVAGIRAGERKTCCAKPLPPPPRLWALNAAASLADAT
jgi:hypothetical protein